MTQSKTTNKRLESIKQQLLGKSSVVASYSFAGASKPIISSDMSCLKRDLFKILILTTLALAVEISLSWAIHQGLLIPIGLR